MKRKVIIAVLFVATSLSSRAGMAQGNDDRPWENHLFVYGWAAGITGTARLGAVERPIDVEFGDILDSLEGGVMARYRGASKTFAVVADLIYVDLGKSMPDAILQRAELEQLVVDLTGAYRFSRAVEAFGGVRVTDVTTRVELGLPSFPEAGTTERRGSETFYDPIVGARVVTPLGENRRWWIQAQGDVGGFGVGTKFTWQATSHVGFRIADWFTLWGGYRALGMDFENLDGREPYSQDIILHGVSFGLGFHF